MATTLIGQSTSKVISNLDTYNFTVSVAAPHVAKIRLTEIPPSGVAIVIKQNATTLITSATPAASQNHVELQYLVNAMVNDVISFIISSSAASDQPINSIKGIIKVNQGLT